MSKFPLYRQADSMTCGVACLQMISSFFGKKFDQKFLLDICHATAEGGFCFQTAALSLFLLPWFG